LFIMLKIKGSTNMGNASFCTLGKVGGRKA
jgi:hypothetical protein